MLTLQEINKQVDLYNSCDKANSVPYFDEIVLINNEKTLASVKFEDLKNDKHIIYVSNELSNYDKREQLAILWHEFTHVADYYKNHDKIDNIQYVLKTYSEAHATSIELTRLSHPNDDNLFWKEGKYASAIEVAKSYFSQSANASIRFAESKHPYDFNEMTTQFCYFCGCLMLYNTAHLAYAKLMQDYPKNYFNEINAIGLAIINHDIARAAKYYEFFFQEQKSIALNTYRPDNIK